MREKIYIQILKSQKAGTSCPIEQKAWPIAAATARNYTLRTPCWEI